SIMWLWDSVDAGRGDVVITVRVALPRAYLFKLKQPPARVRREHQIIVARVFSERCGVETREQVKRLVQATHFTRYRRTATRFQLSIVLMQPRSSRFRRVETVVTLQIFVRDLIEARGQIWC